MSDGTKQSVIMSEGCSEVVADRFDGVIYVVAMRHEAEYARLHRGRTRESGTSSET